MQKKIPLNCYPRIYTEKIDLITGISPTTISKLGEGSARLAALEAGKGTGVNLQVCLPVSPKEVKYRNIIPKFLIGEN